MWEIVESDGEVKMLGDSLRISCNTTGINFVNWFHWARHIPGKGLQWVASIEKLTGDTVHCSDSVKGRLTGLHGSGLLTDDRPKS